MDKYLQGFNDGYKKAMEHVNSPRFVIQVGGKDLARELTPHITEEQKRRKRAEQSFRT